MADEETPSLRKRFRIAAFSAAEEAPTPAADVPVGKPSVAFQQAVVPPRTPTAKSDAPKEEKGLLRRGRNKNAAKKKLLKKPKIQQVAKKKTVIQKQATEIIVASENVVAPPM